jgi:hypothetical protein
VWAIMRGEARWMALSARAFVRPALVGMLLAVALVSLVTEPFATLLLGDESFGRDLTWWSLLPLLSIGLAVFGAWSAFCLRSFGLLGLALVAAIGYLGRFYYLYGATLLAKSAIMLLLGAVMFGVAWLLVRRPGLAP